MRGEHNTFQVSITWEEGELEGPEDLVEAVTASARRLEGQPVKARDADDQIYSTDNHLLNPHSARELIRGELDRGGPFEIEVLEGTFPPAPRYRTRVHDRSDDGR